MGKFKQAVIKNFMPVNPGTLNKVKIKAKELRGNLARAGLEKNVFSNEKLFLNMFFATKTLKKRTSLLGR